MIGNIRFGNTKYLVPLCAFIIVIVGIIVLLFAFGVIGDKQSSKKSKEEIIEQKDNYNSKLEETYTIRDVTMNYSDSWKVDTETDDELILSYNNTKIRLLRGKSNYYLTSRRFAEEMVVTLKKDGHEVLGEPKEVFINDVSWYMVENTYSGSKILQLFLANGYDTYSFTYVAKTEDYNKYLSRVTDIYNTIKADIEIDNSGYEAAKQFLTGEWDWPTNGYLVIENDNFYLYKDSSKSMQNVMYGKISIYDNKIMSKDGEKTDGYYMLGYFDCIIIDGVSKEIETGNGLEIAFTLNDDGTYNAKNINTNKEGRISKVE